ncbi:uncharacterized protein C13orf46 homolog [Tenrec ecaudatus]|uniref:uncharacterized protein C13orf46 homolog n=1 Tax=Tenrec ecaudatus TaxID=94439 RepID=UPI003F594406
MEKETSSTYRRHRPVPGVPPLGMASGHPKAASEVTELQRSRSVGGLHQKGDPPSRLKKLRVELVFMARESEEQGKDSRSEAEDISCQTNLEVKKEKSQEAPGTLVHDGEIVGPEAGKSDSEVSIKEEEEDADKRLQEAKKPSTFVEIDLADQAEEVVASAVKEEKEPQVDAGYLSEDE